MALVNTEPISTAPSEIGVITSFPALYVCTREFSDIFAFISCQDCIIIIFMNGKDFIKIVKLPPPEEVACCGGLPLEGDNSPPLKEKVHLITTGRTVSITLMLPPP